jgi:hypothetical protein
MGKNTAPLVICSPRARVLAALALLVVGVLTPTLALPWEGALAPLGQRGTARRARRPQTVELDWIAVPMRSGRNGKSSIEDYGQFSTLAAGDPARILATRPMDGVAYPTAGNQKYPSVSPDGRYVAFVSEGEPPAGSGDPVTGMWVVDTMTGARGQVRTAADESPAPSRGGAPRRPQRRRVLENEDAMFELAWSMSRHRPRKYAFTSEGRVYVGSPGARSARLLLDTEAYVVFPRWSPDDSSLVFASGQKDARDRYIDEDGRPGREKSGDLYLIDNLEDVLGAWMRPPSLDVRASAPLDAVLASRVPLTGFDDKEQLNEESFTSWAGPRTLVYHSYRGTDGFDLSTVQWPESEPAAPDRRVFSASFRDELYPSVSPLGGAVAFYCDGWISAQGVPNADPRKKALFVSDTTGRVGGTPYLAADVAAGQFTGEPVLTDSRRGPLWSPGGDHLIYIADRADEQYPIYAAPYPRTSDVGPTTWPLTDIEQEANCTAADLARDTGKVLVFSSQIGSRQKVTMAVTNFRSPRLPPE